MAIKAAYESFSAGKWQNNLIIILVLIFAIWWFFIRESDAKKEKEKIDRLSKQNASELNKYKKAQGTAKNIKEKLDNFAALYVSTNNGIAHLKYHPLAIWNNPNTKVLGEQIKQDTLIKVSDYKILETKNGEEGNYTIWLKIQSVDNGHNLLDKPYWTKRVLLDNSTDNFDHLKKQI